MVDTRACVNPNHYVRVTAGDARMVGANNRLTWTHAGVVRIQLYSGVDGTRVYIATGGILSGVAGKEQYLRRDKPTDQDQASENDKNRN